MTDKDVQQARPSPYWRPHQPAASLAGRTCGWLLGLGLLALVLFSVLGDNGLGQYLRLRQQRDDLAADLEAMRAATARLEAQLDALEEDPLALEKLARERYNMRREGEDVILVVPQAESAPTRP